MSKIVVGYIKKYFPAFIYRILRWFYYYVLFICDFIRFTNLIPRSPKRFPKVRWRDRSPQLYDKTEESGYDAHYVYHLAWAARIISKIKPMVHIDISSQINFSTIVSAFIPMEYYDYRPAKISLQNLSTGKQDLTKLSFSDNSILSISCMHVIEHVGLGRYGDKIDPDADVIAIAELKRVLAPGGNLLIVLPIGFAKITFNAHRVYSFDQIITYLSDLHLKEFALLPDYNPEKGLIIPANKEDADLQTYGCGCFWFTKD